MEQIELHYLNKKINTYKDKKNIYHKISYVNNIPKFKKWRHKFVEDNFSK